MRNRIPAGAAAGCSFLHCDCQLNDNAENKHEADIWIDKMEILPGSSVFL